MKLKKKNAHLDTILLRLSLLWFVVVIKLQCFTLFRSPSYWQTQIAWQFSLELLQVSFQSTPLATFLFIFSYST